MGKISIIVKTVTFFNLYLVTGNTTRRHHIGQKGMGCFGS